MMCIFMVLGKYQVPILFLRTADFLENYKFPKAKKMLELFFDTWCHFCLGSLMGQISSL